MTALERMQWPTWSPHSIVTPRISGLNYTEAITAMLEAGLFTAVGDNSRADLKPANPFHGFLASAKVGKGGVTGPAFDKAAFDQDMLRRFGRASVFVIPRFATRVYFDVSLPAQLEMEHNSFYGPECIGYNEVGPIIPYGRKCNTTSYKVSLLSYV